MAADSVYLITLVAILLFAFFWWRSDHDDPA